MRAITTYSRGGFLGALVLGSWDSSLREEDSDVIVAGVLCACCLCPVMPDTFWDRMNTIRRPTRTGTSRQTGACTSGAWGCDMANAEAADRRRFQRVTPRRTKAITPRRSSASERAVHSIWFGVLAISDSLACLFVPEHLGGAIWTCWRVSAACKKDPERNDVTHLRERPDQQPGGLLPSPAPFCPAQYGEMFWHFVCLATALRHWRTRPSHPWSRTPPPAGRESLATLRWQAVTDRSRSSFRSRTTAASVGAASRRSARTTRRTPR